MADEDAFKWVYEYLLEENNRNDYINRCGSEKYKEIRKVNVQMTLEYLNPATKVSFAYLSSKYNRYAGGVRIAIYKVINTVLRDNKLDRFGLGVYGTVGVRIRNALLQEGLKKIEDAVNYSYTDLLRVPNLGKGSVDIIVEALAKKGLLLNRDEE